MRERPTLMLVGLGDLGHAVLQSLIREKGIGKILLCDREEDLGQARTRLARLCAVVQGSDPQLVFQRLDLKDEESVLRTVQKEKPDIVLHTATLMTWWLPELLPDEPRRLLHQAGFGVWLPVHLTLGLKLMSALRKADFRGITVTAPFPDVANCVLGRIGLAPTCGIGNLDEIVPKVRLLAAKDLGVPLQEIRVFLVAHHALEAAVYGEASGEKPPYFLRVEHKGQDVTEALESEKLLFSPFPLPPGQAIHFLTAASAARLIRSLCGSDERLLHAPSPGGLPGGYPVCASRDGVRVPEIPGLTLEEAIAINERSHRFDGIERIEEDGTVVFCDEPAEIMKQLLGYDAPRLRPGECEQRAEELITRFREYARRQGIRLPA